MNTLEFLTELYGEAEGWLTLWNKQNKTTAWLPLDNLQLIADTAQSVGNDIYYGLGVGRQRKVKGRLSYDDVTGIPGLWLDLDIAGPGHKTDNLPTSVDAALEFINSLPITPSIVVNSGGGLHVYYLFKEFWQFESPEERAQAQAISQGWQTYIRSRTNWHIDSTHDLPRILRLPGTYNCKAEPKLVEVIHQSGTRYNPSDFEQFLPITLTEQPTTSAKHDKFKRNKTDGPSQQVIDNCKFIQTCRDYAAELSEPQWTAMISNIARCSDGPTICHKLSRPYPGYSEQETEDKIYHALNDMHPQTCQYVQQQLGFNMCPEGGCGVKAPCGFALKKSVSAVADEKPIPDGFFDTEISDNGAKINKFTDLGNAEYFSKYYDGKVKHCSQMDKWLIWDGKHWVVDTSNQITVLAGKCIRSMYDYLSRIDDAGQRKKIFEHATKSEDARKLKAMVALAKGYMPISVDELDADPWLLNCPDGIIDLKTGELLPHNPSKNMTRIIKANYDKRAKCPTFEKFINSVFDGNENIVRFMQRFLGYCLTGDTREQQFVIAWGALGRNGKGTLLNLMLEMLADYAKTTPTDVLYAKKYDKPSNDVARLAGARFVLASEGEKGKKFDEPLIKKMTGQDMLAARFLYRETFEFMPQFKLVLMTNDKPVASEDDAALWSRIQLVPFTRRFDGKNQDKNLKYRLREPAELAGILQWLIRGCLEWQRTGLTPPEEVLHATREYQSENDKLKDWIAECCVTGEKMVSSPKALYKSFQAWHLENGEKFIMIYKNFTANLEKKGFEKFVGAGNYTKMRGIALVARDEAYSHKQENPY